MRKTLFTPGPVMMFPETLKASFGQVPYFRNAWFSELLLRLEADLLRLVSAPSGSRAVFITGSGTAAMEAAVLNFVADSSNPAVVDGGAFGHRFVDLLQCHGHLCQVLPVDRDSLADGKSLSTAHDDTNALFVTAHETSVGHCYDLAATAAFCRLHDCLHIVDAISLFGTDPLDMTTSEIDVLIISSNKGMAAAPGISMLVLSPRALARRVACPPTVYLDIGPMLKDGARGQTVFTPAVTTLMQMAQRFEMLRDDGLRRAIDHAAKLASHFRSQIEGLPFKFHTASRPNAMTALEITADRINARALCGCLEEDYGLVLAPPSLCVSGSALFRVGHMGNLTIEDEDQLVKALRMLLIS